MFTKSLLIDLTVMTKIRTIWMNLLGDWKSSLLWHTVLSVPLALIFFYLFKNNLYTNDTKTLGDRGWHQGFFLTHLGGPVPYIFFYFFIMAPIQELVFRKGLIELCASFVGKNWISITIPAIMFSSLRLVYPYPLGIVLLTLGVGILYGHDYLQNKSVVVLSIFHFILTMMAITLNLL